MTEEFLAFSMDQGNDLSSEAGVAPPVILESSHERCLEVVSLADLKYHELR